MVLALSLGFTAVIIQIIVLARPHNKGLLPVLAGVMCLWAAHYWLLGSPTASALHIVAALTMIAAECFPKDVERRRKVLGPITMAANLAVGLALYRQPADAFMVIGNIAFAFCHTCLGGRSLRVGYSVSEAIVAIAAFQLGSIPGVCVGIIMIGSNLYALMQWKTTAESNLAG